MKFEFAQFPGYYDGLAVAGFLLVILLMLFKEEKKTNLPPFCAKCANRRQRLASASTYCSLKCKFNPPHAYDYTGNYFTKKAGTGPG